MKDTLRWYSERIAREVAVARWGTFGTPVLIFPTAGGDAEEIERFHVIDVLLPLLQAGRIKVYSCDSVAGRALLVGEGSSQHRGWMQHQFLEFIYQELVPAIRADCRNEDIAMIAAGASIGAFNALAVLCRYPDVFTRALCMSGTYQLERFYDGDPGEWFYRSSPLHFLPSLNGGHLELLRTRFALFASGQGRAENLGESWHAAHVLGAHGIPNRVDPWGEEWPHDWPTWRRMLPQYLDELA